MMGVRYSSRAKLERVFSQLVILKRFVYVWVWDAFVSFFAIWKRAPIKRTPSAS